MDEHGKKSNVTTTYVESAQCLQYQRSKGGKKAISRTHVFSKSRVQEELRCVKDRVVQYILWCQCSALQYNALILLKEMSLSLYCLIQ